MVSAGIGCRGEGAHDPCSVRLLPERTDQVIEPIRGAGEGAQADEVEVDAGARRVIGEGLSVKASLEKGDEIGGGGGVHGLLQRRDM